MMRPLLVALLLGTAIPAQDPPGPAPKPATGPQEPARAPEDQPSPQAEQASRQKLSWPRDRDRVVCRVDGTDHTLEDLLQHIGERHYAGMVELMEVSTGRAYLQHPLMASWVRQYADALALEAEARRRGIVYEDARDVLGTALKKSFELYLANYVARRERAGSPVELTQERLDLLLTDYQRDQGLACEVRGWLDAMVPAVPLDETGRLRDFYNDFPNWFGGVVKVAQIMIEHRDPQTLELLTGETRQRAYEKLADVRSRLAADGSNFEEVARLLSDDERTARNGGRMDGIKRFDDRLPAVICRTAWRLGDGEISEPVESAFGIHVIKRISYQHLYYVFFNDRIKGEIADTMRRSEQEDLLFGARERHRVALLY